MRLGWSQVWPWALGGFVLLGSEVRGGPTQSQHGSQSYLEEVSPLVDNIEVKKNDSTIEVFITGSGNLDCYDIHEYDVEKTATVTRIIPRLRRSHPERGCKIGLKTFRDKAADLDLSNPASKEVEVLGFRGWHRKSLENP